MEIPSELSGILVSTPDTLSGAVRFRGTRVPVQALLDTLYEGDGLEEFFEGWPNVSQDDARAVLRWHQNQARKAFGLELAV